MYWLTLLAYQGLMSRLSGNDFGRQWNLAWLPELLFATPIGITAGYAASLFLGFIPALLVFLVSTAWSFTFMQSATWTFLRWESHDDPDTERSSTLKPIVDWIAEKFGYQLGDEGYAWISAGFKGFLIGLPIGGIPLAILWPLGYELGSHSRELAAKYGIDPHAPAEVFAGVGSGISILIFLTLLSN